MPHALLMTLCERWHPETSNFHMVLGEMIVTLDDVACLMHLQIDGRMLSHEKKMLKHEGVALLMKHLGVSQQDTEKIAEKEYGGYISYPKLRQLYTRYLDRANRLADPEDPRDEEELQKVRTFCVKSYLLDLIGYLLFGDRSNKRIELVYLTIMEEGYAGMRNYSWGGMTLTYLYGELAEACKPGDRALGGKRDTAHCKKLINVNLNFYSFVIFFARKNL